jgi:hypothetical protein
MSLVIKEGRATYVCDRCYASWYKGDKRPSDFRISNDEVLCGHCAPALATTNGTSTTQPTGVA